MHDIFELSFSLQRFELCDLTVISSFLSVGFGIESILWDSLDIWRNFVVHDSKICNICILHSMTDTEIKQDAQYWYST